MARNSIAFAVFCASAVLGLACTERTPTEPAVVAATPTPGAPASLSGLVTDENGVGRPGLFLTCQTLYTTTKVSGPVGSYALGGLQSGATTLTIQQEGVRDPASFALTLAPGANEKNLMLARHHGEPASVTGVVTYGGQVVPRATVILAGKTTITDAGGRYSLEGIETGYWSIDVEWAPYYEVGFSLTLAPGPNVVDVRF